MGRGREHRHGPHPARLGSVQVDDRQPSALLADDACAPEVSAVGVRALCADGATGAGGLAAVRELRKEGETVSESKACARCGARFSRRGRDGETRWASRLFCSVACSNKSRPKLPVEERFWSKVKMGSSCWEWQGSLSRGYGQLPKGAGLAPFKAHRLSYELYYGPIPEGLQINHRCDNRRCVRPSHLYAGTQRQNARDTSRRGRLNPKSLLNLRPGRAGVYGAGPLSKREIESARSQ